MCTFGKPTDLRPQRPPPRPPADHRQRRRRAPGAGPRKGAGATRTSGHRGDQRDLQQLACDGGLDFIATGSAEEGLAILDDPRLWHPTRGFECVVERAIVPNLGRLYEIILRERRPNTVVAASGMCLGARVAQETLGIPVATVHLQPALLRSLADAGMQGRIPMGPRVPRLVKRSLFWLMDKFFGDRLLMPPLNAFRAGLGLPPVDRILKSYIHSPQLVLGLFPDWFGALSPSAAAHAFDGLRPERRRRALWRGRRPRVPGRRTAARGLHARERRLHPARLLPRFRGDLPPHRPARHAGDASATIRGPICRPACGPSPISRSARCCRTVRRWCIPGHRHHGAGDSGAHPAPGAPHAHDQPDNAMRIRRLGLGRASIPSGTSRRAPPGCSRTCCCPKFAAGAPSTPRERTPRQPWISAAGLIEGLGRHTAAAAAGPR